MAYTLEVDYYNSYVVRKSTADPTQYTTPNSNNNKFYYCNWPGTVYGDYNVNGFPNPLFDIDGVKIPAVDLEPPYSISDPDGTPPTAVAVGTYVIEESRIRGGYNNASTDYGVRAYLVEENPEPNHRFNSIIYSGIYNSRTSYNKTNVFSIAEDITKSLDPAYGSIQKMFAEDTNLTIFQENKVSRALIDKDAIYSAEGGGSVTSTNLVIGQITPYSGEYGISKNPESFDYFGFRKYFTDKYRKAVLRLSRDGITEISNYGMSDFFRDELANLKEEYIKLDVDYPGATYSPTQVPPYPINTAQAYVNIYIQFALTGGDLPNADDIEIGSQLIINGSPESCYVTDVDAGNGRVHLNVVPPEIQTTDNISFRTYRKDVAVGVYDTYKDNYILSLVDRSEDASVDDSYHTIAYDEKAQGWVTFYDYFPEHAKSLRNNLYSTKGKTLHRHYDEETPRNSFYGSASFESSIQFVFNPNVSISKNFKTINYEGDGGWQVDSIISDEQIPGNDTDTIKKVFSYEEGLYYEDGVPYRLGFDLKENKYFANLRSDSKVRPGQVIIPNSGEGVSGIKAFFATVTMSTDSTTQVGGKKELFAVSSEYAVSSY